MDVISSDPPKGSFFLIFQIKWKWVKRHNGLLRVTPCRGERKIQLYSEMLGGIFLYRNRGGGLGR